MVEHAAVNRRVVGSSPTRGAVQLTPPAMVGFFFGGARPLLPRSPSTGESNSPERGNPGSPNSHLQGRPGRIPRLLSTNAD